ncbi:MAG: non-homologous end-joining DNA ligase [Longimicrobiales bacterium]
MTAPRIAGRGTSLRLRAGHNEVRLTNLDKPFWPELGYTKADLLQYYADIADVLVPHLKDRAMVMKRYPHGWRGDFFFMKRTPGHAPAWLQTCAIEHGSGSIIDFPMVQDTAALLWVVNLGCIDLNPWYSRCDDSDRPDFLHFDLDPVEGTPFGQVRETALRVRDLLEQLGMPTFIKTTGGRGMHLYVPILRGPTQKQVWAFAKATAKLLEERHPKVITAEYRVARRPKGRVLVDYNQNAWGRTLASIYSVRPTPRASVSTPVTWEEVEAGIEPEELRLDNVPARVRERGDLWRPLLWPTRSRFDLSALL